MCIKRQTDNVYCQRTGAEKKNKGMATAIPDNLEKASLQSVVQAQSISSISIAYMWPLHLYPKIKKKRK